MTAEGLDGFEELKEMRSYPAYARHGRKSCPSRVQRRRVRLIVLVAGRHGQREDSRVVLRCPARFADFHDAGDRARPVFFEALQNTLGVLGIEDVSPSILEPNEPFS